MDIHFGIALLCANQHCDMTAIEWEHCHAADAIRWKEKTNSYMHGNKKLVITILYMVCLVISAAHS